MPSEVMVDLANDKWELPEFDKEVFKKKCHQYALVIPVINEGERIRRQLREIAALELPVDVVIADGGSTDGSLETEFLKEVGVSALLTKLGAGKLSAQLRMGYAWCLRAGYRGIVTVDGNGKDGVERIPDIVDMLKDGYDYVQGSRYIKGGIAQNTPIDRAIANRFIHAPMLSLAGKYKYSDTTNGFRGYSSRYLTDPRVQPFRGIFMGYELLFYLTVRAGQIGMKVGQIGVSRCYPAGEAVPTKINSFSGRLAILKQAIAAALGKYNPS